MENFEKDKYRFSSASPLLLVGQDIIETRSEEISKLNSELIEYKVIIRDLISEEIEYSIRNDLLNIALFVIGNIEIYYEFIENKELPVERIATECGKLNNYVNKYKEYIIAYIIILGNEKYKNIQGYIQIEAVDKEDKESNEVILFNNNEEKKGIVLAKGNKNAIIITSLGEFKKVKVNDTCIKGDEVQGIEKNKISDYKLHISIILVLIAVLLAGIAYSYKHITSTIVIETALPTKIKLDINSYNRVFRIISDTNKGDELINDINVIDKEMDVALSNVIKYINENNMTAGQGIIITVSGKPIEYGAIEKTEEYINSNEIDIRFNNSGQEIKLIK